MVWVKLPDDLFDRPEVVGLDARAVTLHLAALGYSNRLLTDGHIPSKQVGRLTGDPLSPDLAVYLIEAGWWQEAPGGYQLVYLLDQQPSAEHVKRERAQTAKRMADFRSRKQDMLRDVATKHGIDPDVAVRVAQREIGYGVSDDVTDGRVTLSPDPDPDPEPVPGPGPGKRSPRKQRDADASRQSKPAAAAQSKRATPTQAKLAAIVDLVRDAGVDIFPTARDGAALKSCAADAELIAEAYVAAAEGRWNPGGDGFLRGNLSLHLIVARLGGFTASDKRRLWQREAQRYGHYSGTKR